MFILRFFSKCLIWFLIIFGRYFVIIRDVFGWFGVGDGVWVIRVLRKLFLFWVNVVFMLLFE